MNGNEIRVDEMTRRDNGGRCEKGRQSP